MRLDPELRDAQRELEKKLSARAALRKAQRTMEEELSARKLEKEREGRIKALRELPAKQKRFIRGAGLGFVGLALMGVLACTLLLAAPYGAIPFALVGGVGSFMALLPGLSIQAGEAMGRLWDRIRGREPSEPGLELPSPPVDTSYRNVAATDASERNALLGSREPFAVSADAKPVGYGATASAGAAKMGDPATEEARLYAAFPAARELSRQGLPPLVAPSSFSRPKNLASAARLATLASNSSTPISGSATLRAPGLTGR